MGLLDGLRTVLAPPVREVGDEPTDMQRMEWQNSHLMERLAELELALDDEGWLRLGSNTDLDFSRDGLNRIARVANMMYLSHPLIGRGVRVRGYYTWGQGVEIHAEDDRVDDVIQAMIAEETNAEEFFDAEARLLNDVALHNDGNLFTACFTDPLTGAVRLRVLPFPEITRIITDPQDRRQVQYYLREWTQADGVDINGISGTRQMRRLYPDINYRPPAGQRSAQVGGVEVDWYAPVAHLKVGGLRQMLFGVPETYAAIDWARAQRAFLEDWSQLVRSLSRFAWRLTTAGDTKTAKNRIQTSYEPTPGPANPAPAAGGVWIGDAASKMEAIPKTGATTSVEDSRELRMMVAAALDLPDHLLAGDVDVGNLATAQTLDRPTELMVESRRKMWAAYLKSLCSYAVRASIRAPRGALTGTLTIDRVTNREIVQADYDTTVTVEFPDLLEHDIAARVHAIVEAVTLAGSADAHLFPRERILQLLAVALGVEDVEDLIREMPEEPEPEQPDDDNPDDGLAEAVRELRRVVEAAA